MVKFPPKPFKSIQPGDLYNPGQHFYRVVGVYLGAVGQESMVGLRSLDLEYGTAHGEDIDEMLVPLDFIEPQCIYRRVDHGVQLGPGSNLAVSNKITAMGR